MTDRRRQATPVPASASRALTVQEEISDDRHRILSANPNRRTSVFLAHLALQYDGMATRCVLRSQRLEAAITSYGAEKGVRSLRPTHDLKI